MTAEDTWYTITVVQHTGHPRRVDDSNPTEVVACTVLPHLAGDILRATAHQIDPPKPKKPKQPVMRVREDDSRLTRRSL